MLSTKRMGFWKETLRLPQSKFPVRPDPSHHDNYLRKSANELNKWQGSERPAENTFVLHDGPPYANGPLHIGHAINKILKDIILRRQIQKGRRVLYRPSWDCHGLPIEIKALTKPFVQGNGPPAIRKAAKRVATRTVAHQLESFRNMAIMADWAAAWKTMDHDYEIRQLQVFQKMLRQGLIYRKHKPVYWSISSRTALAEAELEYRDDHASHTAYVRFPIVSGCSAVPELADFTDCLYAAIWTTTPWTLPANRAIAISRDLSYSVLRLGGHGLLVASSQVEPLRNLLPPFEVAVEAIPGERLTGLGYRNKLRGKTAPEQPIVHADFVSASSGTGLVHLAPGHGQQDYEACSHLGIDAFAPITDDGHFTPEAFPDQPELLTSAPSILEGGGKAVLDLLGDDVLATQELQHKYPYDWRTKQPVVIRATPQWFINVGEIKEAALQALRDVRFVPESGRARLESFVRGRSEWCISRQRSWGVPIPALYDAQGNAVMTNESVEHIISVMRERTTDAWFSDPEDDPAWVAPSLTGSYRRATDTMDVWFDSGSSWTECSGRADVYLEGSDQHRGWFQSSLLTYVACQKSDGIADGEVTAPFKTLITHGFVLDDEGQKMSKSLGNTIKAEEVMEGTMFPPVTAKRKRSAAKYDVLGPDFLRLWAASSDFTSDIALGVSVLKPVRTMLLKYRLILKMILGSIHPQSRKAAFTKLDQIAIMQLSDTMQQVREAMDNFEFHRAMSIINRWVAVDLSAFYLEAAKDRLYCGDGGGALEPILHGFLRMLAPMAPLLVQEAWAYRPLWMRRIPMVDPLRELYDAPVVDASRLTLPQSQLRSDVVGLYATHDAVKAGLERARRNGLLGNSLECSVVIKTEDGELAEVLARYRDELEAMFVVSHVAVNKPVRSGAEWCQETQIESKEGSVQGTVYVLPPLQRKCERCWRYLATRERETCDRCHTVATKGGRVAVSETNEDDV
ncbi:hypothetical protein CDD83_6800 [Cordyceps sp. RAO-2017]|nr:hypothetical protein CDD83_6800 [Cordyceps sp. RAO-2017]